MKLSQYCYGMLALDDVWHKGRDNTITHASFILILKCQ